MTPPTDSWYAATAHPAPQRPPLAGTVEADVCVVGGGVAGCSTALHLAERGLRVVLLEAERIGAAASGRSGGQLLPGYSCGQEKLERYLGAGDARRLWDWSLEGIELARATVARHAIDCDWTDGHLLVGVRPRHDDELRREREFHERYAYATQPIAHADLGRFVASPRYRSGLYDPHAAHLHPLNYTLGLAAAAERAGATLCEETRALEVRPSPRAGARATVRTAQGEVRAAFVALCGNALLGDTAPAIRARIMPVGTYVVATRPLGADRAAALLPARAAVADMNWILDYFRLSHDHRLLFGGKVSYSGRDPGDVAQSMQRRLRHVFPQLADADVEHAWGGLLDITVNRAPDFGRIAPEVYYVQGFSGHGMALAGLAGRLVAEAIGGQAARFDVYARIPHAPFPGGPLLARPALVAAMAWYRLRDLL